MNYEDQIKAKQDEIDNLRKEQAEAASYQPLLKVGQCLKYKVSAAVKDLSYFKILYSSDSGYGYKLVIYEHFTLKELRLFKNDSGRDVHIPNQDVYFAISQWYNPDSSLKYYEPITEEEYQVAKKAALGFLLNPNIPASWEEATTWRLQPEK